MGAGMTLGFGSGLGPGERLKPSFETLLEWRAGSGGPESRFLPRGGTWERRRGGGGAALGYLRSQTPRGQVGLGRRSPKPCLRGKGGLGPPWASSPQGLASGGSLEGAEALGGRGSQCAHPSTPLLLSHLHRPRLLCMCTCLGDPSSRQPPQYLETREAGPGGQVGVSGGWLSLLPP